MSTSFEWVLAILLHFAPVERLPQFKGYEETPEAARARYTEIAQAIVQVAHETEETSNGLSDRDEMALLAAIAIGESHLAKDADVGPCYRKGAYRTRCDSGAAASVWQNHAWGKDEKGAVTIKRLFAERDLAARRVLGIATSSLSRCRKLPPRDRLSGLSGRCQEGLASAQARWHLWQKIRNWKPKEKAMPEDKNEKKNQEPAKAPEVTEVKPTLPTLPPIDPKDLPNASIVSVLVEEVKSKRFATLLYSVDKKLCLGQSLEIGSHPGLSSLHRAFRDAHEGQRTLQMHCQNLDFAPKKP